ncbi:unnamed protein product [Blepharisma stoltei]|uniref:Uncharacterized protein n=1 Tax=Blepharisma stoltei TaxID=1481888 RepID=A0AAU9J550_9CILI|nr:unnamed protein product [Blepharisma stoltei]
MLRLRLLIQNTRLFSALTPKSGIERAVIDMKLSRSKDLESFLNDMDISKISACQLAYTLKLAVNKSQKGQFESNETKVKLYQIIEKAENSISKLDSNGIVDFCEWLANSHLFKKRFLSIEKKQLLISRITQLLVNKSLDRKQIMSIYEHLPAQGYYIQELEDEVAYITYNPEELSLEEISQIFVANGKYMYSRSTDLFSICMKRIFSLSQTEELDAHYLSKIMESLVCELDNRKYRNQIKMFLKIVENTLPRWKENGLISILKFYKTHRAFDKNLWLRALERIDKMLESGQTLEFAIEIANLLKEDTKTVLIIDKIILNCMKTINSKMFSDSINEVNIRKILDFVKPNIDLETAKLLSSQINRYKFTYIPSFEAFRQASLININIKGKLLPLLNFIPREKFMKNDYSKIENISGIDKIGILNCIVLTKDYKAHGLDRISSIIISSLNNWLLQDDHNVITLCEWMSHREYSTELMRALKPIQPIIYKGLANKEKAEKSVWNLNYFMKFYEADPVAWRLFLTENSNIFSIQGVAEAIKHFGGPFEAINYLLSNYEKKLSPIWIGIAMKKITEISDNAIWNDFLRILNKLDPYDFLNEKSIYTKNDFFYHLNNMKGELSLISDLISGSYKLIKDLPVDFLFDKGNLKVLYLAARLGMLETEVADRVFSNNAFNRENNIWMLLIISLKCSDVEISKVALNKVFNQNMGVNLLTTTIKRYLSYSKNEIIESFIINFLKDYIPKLHTESLFKLLQILNSFSETNKNDHIELWNVLASLTKEFVLKAIGYLTFNELTELISFAGKHLSLDIDYGYILWKNQNISKYMNPERSREKLIEKIRDIGLDAREAVQSVCNKQNDFSSAYLSGTLSCLADLRFEQENWAREVTQNMINFVESKALVFESDREYTNWIYGLVAFRENKSLIMKHIENSKYFDCEQPTFKHFLLADHFQLDPDFKSINIYEEKVKKFWHDFDYFKCFGIDQPLIDHIISSFNKANLEIKAGEYIDGTWAPFYIPSINSAVIPITSPILLYYSNIIRGDFHLHRQHLLKKVNNVIILSKEDTTKNMNLDIRKYLKI